MKSEQSPEFKAWFESRPEAVKELVRKLPPYELYRAGTWTVPVRIAAYEAHDDGTVTLSISWETDRGPKWKTGVKPEELAPWNASPLEKTIEKSVEGSEQPYAPVAPISSNSVEAKQ